MKVAHLTTVDLSLRYLLLAQLDASIARGDEVIGISAPGPDVDYLESRGVRHVALASSTRSMDLRADLRAAWQLWRVLRRERPDVLHTHNPKPGIYGRVIGRLAGVPRVVHTTHGLYATPDDGRTKRALVYTLEAIASRFSHVELVQNPEDLVLMRRLRIAAARKLRYLGNGVDLNRFAPDAVAPERTAARAELGLGDEAIVVGCVARLVDEKGIGELVDALALMGPPFRLLLVGPHDPAKADAVDEAVLARARSSGAVLTGHRADVERMYAAMDVFCLPSHREGFPRAAMEAAACGLAVVATDVRGCREVVADGVSGALFPLGSAAALADALMTYRDASVRRRHGAASRARAEENFDERRVVERVLTAYDSRSGVDSIAVWIRPLRVLQVVTDTDRRGAQVFGAELGNRLTDLGLDVRTVALCDGATGGLDIESLGGRRASLAGLWRLRRAMKAADVTVAHGSSTLAACAVAGLGPARPFVYRQISDPAFWASTWLRWARVALYYRFPRAVVALADDTAALLSLRFRVRPERITVIANAVDERRWLPATAADRAAAREGFGFGAGAKVVAFVGAVAEEKGILDLVGALPAGCSLLIAGEGPGRDAAAAAAESRGADVRFLGSLDDARPVYAAADVVVLPSWSEQHPAVLIEAALTGTPVVASAVGAVGDIVDHGATGVLVPARSPAALATAIEAVLADPGRSATLAAAAAERCARFTLAATAPAWVAVLRAVAERGRRGAP